MKLHLPVRLRSALLACCAAVTSIVTTVGTGAIAGGAFVAIVAAQQAAAVTDIIIGNGAEDGDGSWSYVENATADEKAAMETVGSSAYTLKMNDNTIVLTIDRSIYVNNLLVGEAQPTSVTLNLGSAGAIHAASGNGGINFGQAIKENGSITLNVAVSEDQLATLTTAGTWSRELLTTPGTAQGFWNFSDAGVSKKLNVTGLAGYEVLQGIVTDRDSIGEGQIGLWFEGDDVLHIVAKAPAPSSYKTSVSVVPVGGGLTHKYYTVPEGQTSEWKNTGWNSLNSQNIKSNFDLLGITAADSGSYYYLGNGADDSSSSYKTVEKNANGTITLVGRAFGSQQAGFYVNVTSVSDLLQGYAFEDIKSLTLTTNVTVTAGATVPECADAWYGLYVLNSDGEWSEISSVTSNDLRSISNDGIEADGKETFSKSLTLTDDQLAALGGEGKLYVLYRLAYSAGKTLTINSLQYIMDVEGEAPSVLYWEPKEPNTTWTADGAAWNTVDNSTDDATQVAYIAGCSVVFSTVATEVQNVSIAAAVSANDMTISSGSYAFSTTAEGSLAITGNLKVSAGATADFGTMAVAPAKAVTNAGTLNAASITATGAFVSTGGTVKLTGDNATLAADSIKISGTILDGTWSATGAVLGTGVSVAADGNVTLTDATLGATVTNAGTLNLSGSLNIAPSASFVTSTDGAPVYSDGDNGFKTVTKNYQLVNDGTLNVSGVNGVQKDGVAVEAGKYSFDGNNLNIHGEKDGTLYWVNKGEGDNAVTYTATATKFTDATGFALNGSKETAELVLNAPLADTMKGEGKGIQVQSGTNKLKIESGVELSQGDVTVNGGTVTLHGSGTYELGDTASKFIDGVSLGSGWTGTVVVTTESVHGPDLANLGIKGSTVKFHGAAGDLPGDYNATYNFDIELENAGEASAFTFSAATADCKYTFAGAVSGAGTIEYTATNGGNNEYTFSGSLEKWYGSFKMNSADKTVAVRLEGGGEINASTIVDAGTLNVTIGPATEDTTVNSSIAGTNETITKDTTVNSSIAGTNVTITGDTEVADGGSLSVAETGTLTVNADKSLTINGSATLDGNVDNDGTLTINKGTTIGGDVDNAGSITLQGDSTIKGNLSGDGALEVAGSLTLEGEENAAGNLSVGVLNIGSNSLSLAGEISAGRMVLTAQNTCQLEVNSVRYLAEIVLQYDDIAGKANNSTLTLLRSQTAIGDSAMDELSLAVWGTGDVVSSTSQHVWTDNIGGVTYKYTLSTSDDKLSIILTKTLELSDKYVMWKGSDDTDKNTWYSGQEASDANAWVGTFDGVAGEFYGTPGHFSPDAENIIFLDGTGTNHVIKVDNSLYSKDDSGNYDIVGIANPTVKSILVDFAASTNAKPYELVSLPYKDAQLTILESLNIKNGGIEIGMGVTVGGGIDSNGKKTEGLVIVGDTGNLKITETGTLKTGEMTGADSDSAVITNEGKLTVGTIDVNTLTNTGTLNVTNGTIGTLAGDTGRLEVAESGSVTIGSATTIGALDNGGSLTVEGSLKVTDSVDAGGTLTADSLQLGAAGDKDAEFEKLVINDGGTVNAGNLTVGDGSSLGAATVTGLTTKDASTVTMDSLSAGSLSIGEGSDVTIEITDESVITLESLVNNGKLHVWNGTLNLADGTTNGGAVDGNAVQIGKDSTFDSLNVNTVTDNGAGTNLEVGEGSYITSLTVGSLTVTETATANDTVIIGSTDSTTELESIGGAGAVTIKGNLNLTGTTGGSADVDVSGIGTLTISGAGDDALGQVEADELALGLGDVVVDGVLLTVESMDVDSINLTCVTGDTVTKGEHDVLKFTGDLSDETLAAYQEKLQLNGTALQEWASQGGWVKLEANEDGVLSMNIMDKAAAEADGLVNTWIVGDDTTSNGFEVYNTQDAVPFYRSLDNVVSVSVDGDSSIDLTDAAGAGTAEDNAKDAALGLTIRNLNGEGELEIKGDSAATDVATIFAPTDDSSAAGIDLVANNVTVNIGEPSTRMRFMLRAAAPGTIVLNSLTATGDAVYNVNKPTEVTDAVKLDGANTALHVKGGSLSIGGGLEGTGTITGEATITGTKADGSEFNGSYGDGAILHVTGGKQTLATGANLTADASGSDATLILSGNQPIAGLSGSDGATIVLEPVAGAAAPALTADKVTIDGANLEITLDTAAATESLTDGPTIIDGSGKANVAKLTVNLTPATTVDVPTGEGAETVALALLMDGASADEVKLATDDTTKTVLEKYFTLDSAMVNGDGYIVVDRNDDYFTEEANKKNLLNEENAIAGAAMLDRALVYADPQQNADDYAQLADIMTAMEGYTAAGNAKELNKLAASVAGASTASMGAALSGDMQRQLRAIRNRTTTMGVDQCVVNHDMPYFNAWINAEGNRAELDADGLNSGYTMDSWGGTVGFDVDATPQLTFGLALTAMYGDFTANSAETASGDMDTYYLTAFARYVSGRWTHTFVAAAGKSEASLERNVHGYDMKGDTDGTSIGMMYEVGYVYALDEDATACLQPVLNFTFSHSSMAGYTEEGGDAALNVGDMDMTTFTIGAGARLQASVGENLYNRTSVLEARALVKFNVGDTECEGENSIAAIPGSGASVTSADMGAVGFEFGAGLTIPVGQEGGAIFVDASAEISSGYTNVNGTVGYRINF